MGQNRSSRLNDPQNPITPETQRESLSSFYIACRNGDVNTVKKLLRSLSIEQIDRFERNGSTALHVASYYGHKEIVEILLNAGACRSLRNFRHHLTPFQEAQNDDIRRLFLRANLPIQARFLGSSSYTEWSLDTSLAAEWKNSLSLQLQPKTSFHEMISFLKENYLKEYVNLPSNDLEKIFFLFHLAYSENNPKYLIKAYTSTTQFYTIVNSHFAEYLLKCFRFDHEHNLIEQCVANLASIFIHQLELRSLIYTGTVYRGLLLFKSDLEIYVEKKRLLNKTFLSTSKDRCVALVYAGVGCHGSMRTTVQKTPLQYTALCIYQIRNPNTALDISTISEIPDDNEVIIMPLCAFEVQSVHKNENNADIQIEITLTELTDESLKSDKAILQQKRPRVT